MNDRKRATAAFIDIDALLQDTWLQAQYRKEFKFRLGEHSRNVKHTGAALEHFDGQRMRDIKAEILIFQT